MVYMRRYTTRKSPKYRRAYNAVSKQRRNKWAGSRNKRVGGFAGVELKYVDTARSNAALPNTITGSECDPNAGSPAYNCINPVGQGVGSQQRIGQRYIMKGIDVNGTLTWKPEPNSDEASTEIRVLIVLDKQTNGTQLNAEDVLTSATSHRTNAFRNLQYTKRFQVLFDKTFTLTSTAGGEGDIAGAHFWGEIHRQFQVHKKFTVPVQCRATNMDIQGITDNSLHLLAFKGNQASASGVAGIHYDARVRFTDA